MTKRFAAYAASVGLGIALAVFALAEAKKPQPVPPPGPLPPAEAAKRLKVPGDLKLDQILTEPVVAQPLSMSWDERGRLWVVQYLQYPYPAGLKILSEDKFL